MAFREKNNNIGGPSEGYYDPKRAAALKVVVDFRGTPKKAEFVLDPNGNQIHRDGRVKMRLRGNLSTEWGIVDRITGKRRP